MTNFSSILTAQKMIRAAEILSIPIYVTTQNRARLGDVCAELPVANAVETADKTAFSMWTPPIAAHFEAGAPSEIVLVGIESHICVTQTALDVLAAGHKVYVLADGVSSCNPQEAPIALARLRAAGAVVTTSESFLFECMGDAGIPEYVHFQLLEVERLIMIYRFRAIAGLVKETSANTKKVMETLLSRI
jgi:hypothetical protein